MGTHIHATQNKIQQNRMQASAHQISAINNFLVERDLTRAMTTLPGCGTAPCALCPTTSTVDLCNQIKPTNRTWYTIRNSSASNGTSGLGFQSSSADTSLFVLHTTSVTTFVLVYVDDLVITSSSDAAIDTLLR